MFFILSKILYFIFQPLTWVVALMGYSLFSKKRSRKKKALIAALVMTLFFTNHFLFNQAAKLWELETITADQIEAPYDIGILLGGYSNPHILPRHDRMNFSISANRFINAYELYRTGKIKKLLLSGGTGDLLQKQPGEAELMHAFLTRIGVPESDIIMENESRNTWENAVFTKKILDKGYPGASCLLITSASHMRRSIGCFKKAGVECTPFSAHFLTEKDRIAPENTIIPDQMGFQLWNALIHEWIGYVAYAVKGYI